MNNVETSKRSLSRWFAMALVALLFASSGIVYAQKDKDKATKPATPPPARSAPAPAARPAPAASRPAPTSAPANTGRGTPANQPGRRPLANQPGRPPVANQPGRPPVMNRPGPRPEFHGSNGSSVGYAPSGHPTVVRTAGGATIVHAPSGGRRIEVVRPGGRVIVTNAAGHGYMQRPINVRGHAFVQRTYYVHGAAYPRFYRESHYRGITFNVYTPVRFYSPRFYAWGYTPWDAPVYYNFGFAASPWYGFYGGYFAPYPTYAGPNY
jgi:hypothetical protein